MGCSPDVGHLKPPDPFLQQTKLASNGGNKELENIYINVQACESSDKVRMPSHFHGVCLHVQQWPHCSEQVPLLYFFSFMYNFMLILELFKEFLKVSCLSLSFEVSSNVTSWKSHECG